MYAAQTETIRQICTKFPGSCKSWGMQSIHLLRVAGKQILIQLFLFHLCSYKTDRVNALKIWLTCLSCCEKSAPLRSFTLFYAPNRGIKLQQLAELRFNVQYFYHFVDWTKEIDEIKSKHHQHFSKTIWNNQFWTLPPRILRCFEQKVCVCKSGQTKLTRSYFWETNANFEFGMHSEKFFFFAKQNSTSSEIFRVRRNFMIHGMTCESTSKTMHMDRISQEFCESIAETFGNL